MYEYNFKFQKSGIGNMYNNNKDKQTLKCLSINFNAFCSIYLHVFPIPTSSPFRKQAIEL